MNSYDIEEAFRRIEMELIASAMRNLARHQAEEEDMGFRWTQWQVEQLRLLEEYKRSNTDRFKKQFKEINGSIDGLITAARESGNAEAEEQILRAIRRGAKLQRRPEPLTGGFFNLNTRKLEALIEATVNDFDKAEHAMLRRANDQYRSIIYSAQVYANTGAGTYQQAVDMAAKDFLSAGINCIEYSNGARHTMHDYASMVIRTATKRAKFVGEGEKRKEWGITTVIVNKRGNPCPKCLPFVGKIFIDDIWSGGKSTDGNYPLLSTAVAAGLYHPNCKDSHHTYFPGITSADGQKLNKEDVREIQKNTKEEAEAQYVDRQVEKYDRLEKHSLDESNKKKYAARREEWKRRQAERTIDQMSAAQLKDYADSNLKTRFDVPKGTNAEALRGTVKVIQKFESSLGGETLEGLSVQFVSGLKGVYAKYDDKTNSLLIPKGVRPKAAEQNMTEANARYRIKWKTDQPYYATETFSGTVWHELGHAVDISSGQKLSRRLGAADLDEKSVKVSAYAGTTQLVRVSKRSEAWAENYAAYMDSAETRRRVPAEIAEVIEDGNTVVKAELKKNNVDNKYMSSMATDGEKLKWPDKGEPISSEDRKMLHAYAEERNITIQGLKKADIDVELTVGVIDQIDSLLKMFPEVLESSGGKGFSLIIKEMDDNDFAESPLTNTHTVIINEKAFRNREKLKENYESLESEGFFVKGTDYTSIMYHEFGHLLGEIHKVDCKGITMKLINKALTTEVQKEIKKKLSGYAGTYIDFSEVISEALSAYLSGADNSFALQFVEESGIIKQ